MSAHYFVREDGGIVQSVPEARRAWHAGESSWEDKTDVNSRSIGIEIANGGHDFGYPDFPDAQIAAVIAGPELHLAGKAPEEEHDAAPNIHRVLVTLNWRKHLPFDLAYTSRPFNKTHDKEKHN